MYALLDNLTSVIVGASVFLLLVVMHVQMQQATVERAVHYMSKRQAIETGKWLQEDISNIGSGMNTEGAALAIDEIVQANDGITQAFVFKRRLSEGASTSTIAYELERSDTLIVQEDGRWKTLQLYQLKRTVDGSVDGRSMKNLSSFKVEFLNRQGEVTQVATEAAQVRVRFATAARYVERQKYISRNHWATTVPLRGANN